MKKIGKDNWLIKGSAWSEEEALQKQRWTRSPNMYR